MGTLVTALPESYFTAFSKLGGYMSFFSLLSLALRLFHQRLYTRALRLEHPGTTAVDREVSVEKLMEISRWYDQVSKDPELA